MIMLSKKTIEVIKSTIPILEEHGVILTEYFYNRMFENNPEVKPYFNPTHQADSTQPKALAASICAYAKNIENLDALGSAVELIAQKHTSLMVSAEQYPIVGENLLCSISEVLQLPMTDDVIIAWGEAYHLLATILINREAEIYAKKLDQPTGWHDFKPLKVVHKVQEANDIISFYLQNEDKSSLPPFNPGQYITVRLDGPFGYTTMRNYSLSCAPNFQVNRIDTYRISVKKEKGKCPHNPDGFVSAKLHEINAGSTLQVCAPSGHFFLDSTILIQKPLVLLSGGIGITPMLSILHSVLESNTNQDIYFIHGTEDGNTHAFSSELQDLDVNHKNLTIYYCYNTPTAIDTELDRYHSIGYVNRELLKDLLPTQDCEYYFCGPIDFMRSIYNDLKCLKVPNEQIHFEFFGSLQAI
jgi:nitric oxide dioxygenase